MSMDVRHLRAFVAVFEARNVTQAARLLCITQPTLSATLAQLEASLGTRLFLRQARGVEPLEAARRLYPQARRLLAELSGLSRQVRDDVPRHPLRVGVEADVGRLHVAGMLAAVVALSSVEVEVQPGCWGDVRLGCETLCCEDELFLPLWEEPFVLAVPAVHPLATLTEAGTAELAGMDWVICPAHDSHQRLLAWMGGQMPGRSVVAGSLSLAAAMVAAGLGVAWLPSSLLEGNVCGVPLHGGTYRRRIGLCYAPDMRELPAVSALLAAFAEAEPAAG